MRPLEKIHENYIRKPARLQRTYKVLLMDDDPVYQNLFKSIGKKMGVSISSYESLADMMSFTKLNNYDMIFLDYYLENWTGTEIAEYVDVFFPNLPVFLISADKKVCQGNNKPHSIKKSYCKSTNPYDIIIDAIRTLEKIDIYQTLSDN